MFFHRWLNNCQIIAKKSSKNGAKTPVRHPGTTKEGQGRAKDAPEEGNEPPNLEKWVPNAPKRKRKEVQ